MVMHVCEPTTYNDYAFVSCSEDRNSTSKNKMVPSGPVITPAVNFIILNDTVSLYMIV